MDHPLWLHLPAPDDERGEDLRRRHPLAAALHVQRQGDLESHYRRQHRGQQAPGRGQGVDLDAAAKRWGQEVGVDGSGLCRRAHTAEIAAKREL